VERITVPGPDGGFSVPAGLEQEAAERLGRYEDAHGRLLARQTALGLSALPGVRVFARPDLSHQAGVLSFTAEGHDVEQIASALGQQEIAVRAGLHCAPSAHRQAGTLESGTVRVSFSHWNTMGEVEQFLDTMRRILQ